MIRLTLPYPPSANRMWRSIGHGRTILSAEARRYKQDAAICAGEAGVTPLEGPILVTLAFYRPAKRGDLDNYIKSAIDSMNGLAWIDDSQIVRLEAARYEDAARPRVEVTVSRAGGTAG